MTNKSWNFIENKHKWSKSGTTWNTKTNFHDEWVEGWMYSQKHWSNIFTSFHQNRTEKSEVETVGSVIQPHPPPPPSAHLSALSAQNRTEVQCWTQRWSNRGPVSSAHNAFTTQTTSHILKPPNAQQLKKQCNSSASLWSREKKIRNLVLMQLTTDIFFQETDSNKRRFENRTAPSSGSNPGSDFIHWRRGGLGKTNNHIKEKLPPSSLKEPLQRSIDRLKLGEDGRWP